MSEAEQELYVELLSNESIPVPFEEVVVRKVITFMEHEFQAAGSKNRMPRRLPTPLPQNRKFESLVPEWYGQFLKDNANSLDDLHGIYSCASFMEVKPLMLLCSAKIAN